MAKPQSGSSLNATIKARIRLAAENNADWYQMMAEVHGLAFRREDWGFIFQDAPPAYHSGMTLTALGLDADIVGQRPTCTGVKDAWAVLDLSSQGLKSGIGAQWIWADAAPQVDTSGWEQVQTHTDLQTWEAAWRAGGSPCDRTQFPSTILDRADVAIFGKRVGHDYVAGGIMNRSTACIGLSNCFGPAALPAVAALAHAPGLPLVGYEWGGDLELAIANGFVPLGPLTIWFQA